MPLARALARLGSKKRVPYHKWMYECPFREAVPEPVAGPLPQSVLGNIATTDQERPGVENVLDSETGRLLVYQATEIADVQFDIPIMS